MKRTTESKKIRQSAESDNGNIYQSGGDINIAHSPPSSKPWYEKLRASVAIAAGLLTIYITLRFTIPNGQGNGSASFLFHGFVVDGHGEYISDASITVRLAPGSQVIGEGTTEQSGYFEFEVAAVRETSIWVTVVRDSAVCFTGRKILDSGAELICPQ
jgi:hypothetical protein